MNPPTSIRSVSPGGIYYLEVWASDMGPINTGLTSAYIDLIYSENETSAQRVIHSEAFNLFPSGLVSAGQINEIGGSNLPGKLGIEPLWVRVAIIEMRANTTPSSVTHSLAPSTAGVACYGRGLIPWKDIELSSSTVTIGDANPFKRGDTNQDGNVDISDPISTLGFLFLGNPETLACMDASDANDDGEVDISDAITTLTFKFLGGVEIPAPGPESCGIDQTSDEQTVCEYDPTRC